MTRKSVVVADDDGRQGSGHPSAAGKDAGDEDRAAAFVYHGEGRADDAEKNAKAAHGKL